MTARGLVQFGAVHRKKIPRPIVPVELERRKTVGAASDLAYMRVFAERFVTVETLAGGVTARNDGGGGAFAHEAGARGIVPVHAVERRFAAHNERVTVKSGGEICVHRYQSHDEADT